MAVTWVRALAAAFKMNNIAESQLLSRLPLLLLLQMGITGSTVALFGIVTFISSLVYLLKCSFPNILEELWKHQVLVLCGVSEGQ